jgi:hypothetical protein
MTVSPQFRATATIATLSAGLWVAVGVFLGGVGAVEVGSRVVSIASNALMFGCVGAISGLGTSLLIARGEKGRQPEQIAVARFAAWGALGGAIPALLFAVFGLVFGPPLQRFASLFGLGGLGALVGGLLGTTIGITVRRAPHAKPVEQR